MNKWGFCVRNALALVMAGIALTAHAQQKEIKIGVIYDYPVRSPRAGRCRAPRAPKPRSK